jgi:hypothetical protein
MLTILSISVLLFALYIITIIALFGVPASISDSFYLLKGKKKGTEYFFTMWCYAVAITMMVIIFSKSEGKWFQFFGLFAGGGLGFVGTATMFKSSEKVIHYVSAALCAVSSILWIIFSGYWLITIVIFGLSAIIITSQYKKSMFFLEIACFISMYLTLFFMML